MDQVDAKDAFIVEIGSNDGIMLQHFHQRGLRHLGVEPSANVADAARKRGLHVVERFFDANLATEIVSTDGKADAILGANVMCHIPPIGSVFEGVGKLLKPDGIFVFEDPYLGDIIEKTSYDQIYDEHIFYFSATAIQRLAKQHGLELVAAFPQPVHGGSMRYVIKHAGAGPVDPSVDALLKREQELALDQAPTFRRFAERVAEAKVSLRSALVQLREEGKRVVGYGATSKSTTVLNYCDIGPELIEFISDTTPVKQGKLTPGMHIPVRAATTLSGTPPDVAVLFAWNHAEEILEKETSFRENGGRFLVYVPEVRLI